MISDKELEQGDITGDLAQGVMLPGFAVVNQESYDV